MLVDWIYDKILTKPQLSRLNILLTLPWTQMGSKFWTQVGLKPLSRDRMYGDNEIKSVNLNKTNVEYYERILEIFDLFKH